MAEAVFFFHGKLCHGLSQLGQQKNWIIAKPACAAFFGDDLSFAKTFKDLAAEYVP